MNVFYLDHDPAVAAQAMCDQHVVKMVTETAQILSTVARLTLNEGACEGLYRRTRQNHPVVRAAIHDGGYLRWTFLHGLALADEYTHRFDKYHAALRVIRIAGEALDLAEQKVSLIRNGSIPLCMPDALHSEDTVESYRDYYADKAAAWDEKQAPMRYTRREPPVWLVDRVGGVRLQQREDKSVMWGGR